GTNDPFAVFLVLLLVEILLVGDQSWGQVLSTFAQDTILGCAIGWFGGRSRHQRSVRGVLGAAAGRNPAGRRPKLGAGAQHLRAGHHSWLRHRLVRGPISAPTIRSRCSWCCCWSKSCWSATKAGGRCSAPSRRTPFLVAPSAGSGA